MSSSDDNTGATKPDAPAPKAARRAAAPTAASETPKPRADVPEASAPPAAPAAAPAPAAAQPATPAKVRLRVTHGRIVIAGHDNGAPVGTVLEMSAAEAKRIFDVGVAEYVK